MIQWSEFQEKNNVEIINQDGSYTKGMIFSISSGNSSMDCIRIISVESSDVSPRFFNKGYVEAVYKDKVKSIKKIRLPKIVGDKLKDIYKQCKEEIVLKKEFQDLEKKLKEHRDHIVTDYQSVKNLYFENSNDISQQTYLETIINNLNKYFDDDDGQYTEKKAYIEISYSIKDKKYQIKIEFMKDLNRYFSKEDYDARREYEAADKQDLINRFAIRVNPELFKSYGDVEIKFTTGLGDKGSVAIKTHISITLKKPIDKNSFKTIEDSLLNSIKRYV